MLKDITLGQYFPGDTLAHRLDPRTKLLVTVLYVVALFTAKSFIAYGLLILTLVIAVRISHVGAKALFKGLKPVLFIIAFTALLNLFYTPGTEIFHWWIFRMTIEGVRAAITMMLRITLLIMGTFLLTYTTSPIRLTDGLESLLGPLKAIKLPVHELAMMMSIALRFIPTLIEETDKIMSAQKARGADFETGNLFHRAKALVPILVPLFISAFRRADELHLIERLLRRADALFVPTEHFGELFRLCRAVRMQDGEIQQRRVAVAAADEPPERRRREGDALFLFQMQHVACHAPRLLSRIFDFPILHEIFPFVNMNFFASPFSHFHSRVILLGTIWVEIALFCATAKKKGAHRSWKTVSRSPFARKNTHS